MIDCSILKSNCLIFAECCQQYYCCWICHNLQNEHLINHKQDISHVKCRQCNAINIPSNKCTQCHIQFNKYYCENCIIWHNQGKSFHCENCQMCYRGKRKHYIHCYNCDICIPRTKWNMHNCEIINNQDTDCPICLENLYKFKRTNITLPCGHTIHQKCYSIYKAEFKQTNRFECLFCFRSINELTNEARERQNPIPSAPPL